MASTMSVASRSESVEMYLKTLAELGQDQKPVSIARVAERLRVTHVSANEMMKRLVGEKLITHALYKDVALTAVGRQLAHNIIRRERLWERFLVDHLKLDWGRAHQWACQLEHATPPELADALDVYLDHPETCPQGNPIPRASGEVIATVGLPLSDLPLGFEARILAIRDESPDVLDYLLKRGLQPGCVLVVTEAAPVQGPLTLRLDNGEVVIGLNLAARILVEPLTLLPAQSNSNGKGESVTNTTQLSQMQPGQRATIVHVGGQSAVRRRYMEMGIVKGETVHVERIAPLGDPIEYLIKGYHLSLRRAEADQITVAPLREA
jgi:DtxR family Mn-dependent transcriptional regulator